jgi:hypothetical protein
MNSLPRRKVAGTVKTTAMTAAAMTVKRWRTTQRTTGV